MESPGQTNKVVSACWGRIFSTVTCHSVSHSIESEMLKLNTPESAKVCPKNTMESPAHLKSVVSA